MCIRYIRHFQCPQGSGQSVAEHTLSSMVPCSNPTPCVDQVFGTRDVSINGPCEQHASPNDSATSVQSENPNGTGMNSSLPRDIHINVNSYIDNLLDFLLVLMNEALPRAILSTEYATLPGIVEIIARELRCPRCGDDITICPCSPSQKGGRYNLARTVRIAESQRLLATVVSRFGGDAVRRAAQESSGGGNRANRPRPTTDLLFDIQPLLRDEVSRKERLFRDSLANYRRRRSAIFDQGDALERTQWSAINLIGNLVIYDTGVPEQVVELIARGLLPMLFPMKARPGTDSRYRFSFELQPNIGSALHPRVVSLRLTDIDFWNAYQDMIQQFESLFYRNDTHHRDLNSVSNVLLARLEDLRSTYAGLRMDERETFYTVAKDLLPVTKHFRHRDLGGTLDAILYRCTVCNAQFSQQFTEPLTPPGGGNVGTTPVLVPDGGFVHNPVCYQNCASEPHSHAFCLREWSRNLMVQNNADNTITGIKGKEEWRCNTCFVDPWSTVARS